ncbi:MULTISPECIES: class I SAM-dependent methyltransferase [Amycolatopsis]|uniref:Class I SAM-dependent methyltransferase n=1 Tax=Amycolatopsis echigonensis TaxID=2576905 RepID=A0A2N3WNN0_9PSEU|nr:MULTISPECIES: class I SAM-dependent methyltransferase [Amycolatopsis]MBB2498428.1 class I SAM-dependent methyltransferase [Amycolatopsis echigonensis]PKV95477.1 methyltransferase family protein [Amycolatopsis niigatensis]
MDRTRRGGTDWAGWLRRWDAQQEGYVDRREARFSAMLDVAARLLPASFVALDLACGPGSMSQRLLARFPEARVLAVDIDPVMLEVGRGALGSGGGRLRWIEADLASSEWLSLLGGARVDAAFSSTALHWLEPAALTRLYRDLSRVLPPGGLFLNGDHLPFGPELPTFAGLSERALAEQWSDSEFAARGIETAEQWWEAFAADPAAAPLLAKRKARFAGKRRPETRLDLDAHVAALRDAGFREAGTIWQELSNRVLLAVR